MFIQVKNENYGQTVATYGDYVVVGNPTYFRWNPQTASVICTGSIDVFRYNKSTDEHDFINTIYDAGLEIDIDLIAENSGSYPLYLIEAESASFSSGIADILIDQNNYTSSLEDGFGISVDMYGKLMIAGSPYVNQIVVTSASLFGATGSNVQVHDFARTEFVPASQSSLVASIENPNLLISNSFGRGVSINSSWIAIGSPLDNSSIGSVFMYRNVSTGSFYSWSYYQTITPTVATANAQFGSDLKLNKQSGSFSQSLVVGCANTSSAVAYYFELISGSWTETFVFSPTTDILPLTFGGYAPYNPTMSIENGFGFAVSTFENTVIVGAPYDRSIYEYSGSELYNQGAVYIFEKCKNLNYTKFDLVLKTYGTDTTIRNNHLGYSVDVFGGNAVVGIPKVDNNSMSSCFIQGTLSQLHDCTNNLNNLLLGQVMLIQKNTSSLNWDITNVYQKKKRFLNPYRDFGNDVGIADKSMIIGAPMPISDSNRQINIYTTQSNDVGLGDVCGKAYIYNLNNLREEFHVGNVFYRNGKIVLMTSGSVFDGLFVNPLNSNAYEYDMQFKGQHTIFEKQIVCSVDPGEFNVSTNPSAIFKPSASFDINNNGQFDFQDVDIILRYMQYKNTAFLGLPTSTDWSSSIVIAPDEISLLKFYQNQTSYKNEDTRFFASESIVRWELTDTWMQTILDVNEDNRIDVRDMNIIWKYFTNRLTQGNYATYITPSSERKLFSDVMDYLNFQSKKTSAPQIRTQFLDYENNTAFDKTGSFLAPMATTIGLYSGLDLIAVAKLGTPIKIIPDLPMNFVIKMDY